MFKFQPLCAVQGHKQHPLAIAVHPVDICHKRHFFQKLAQRRLILFFLISHHLADQLLYILNAVSRVLLIGLLQLFQIPGEIQHILHKFLQTVKLLLAAETLYHGDKRLQLPRAPPDRHNLIRLREGVKKADISLIGIFLYPRNGCRTDAAPWHIDDPLYRHVILAVVDGLQIGKHVLDLPSGIKVGAADHVIGNAFHDKPFFQKAGLGVGAVEHGALPIGNQPSLFLSGNVPGDIFRLLISCVELPETDARPFLLVCPERLVLAPHIVFDHRVGRIQNHLGRAVILLQLDHAGVRVNLLKVQNIADIRPPEFINRLVVIAHHAQVPVLIRQKPDQLKLGGVGILILVHHNVAESVLIGGKHLGVRLEKLHRLHNEIVKIQCVIFL